MKTNYLNFIDVYVENHIVGYVQKDSDKLATKVVQNTHRSTKIQIIRTYN